ncbi:MAG: 16S rRNA (guanine(527)-N(7))-methyltransferase RsmG [Halanaerobiales bacterium]
MSEDGLSGYSRDNFKAYLASGLQEMNLNFEEDILNKCCIYYEFLCRENEKYNLTAITEPEAVVRKHFLDSLSPFSVVSPPAGERVLDIGTGAGFPGMVLKLFFPKAEYVLLDARKKRIDFLKLLAHRLKLSSDLDIIHSRAEEAGRLSEHRGVYDIVLSRAVAPVNILIEYALPFATKKGKLLLYKGREAEEELSESEEALSVLGGEPEGIYEVIVPGLEAERRIVVIAKEKKTPPKYPRRPGIPKKRPL